MDTHKNEPAAGSCWTALGHGVQAKWSLVSIYDPRRASRSVVISRCLSIVQMLWGERRGHGTMVAVQRLPMELTHVATFSF
jgi:hypothetical protein